MAQGLNRPPDNRGPIAALTLPAACHGRKGDTLRAVITSASKLAKSSLFLRSGDAADEEMEADNEEEGDEQGASQQPQRSVKLGHPSLRAGSSRVPLMLTLCAELVAGLPYSLFISRRRAADDAADDATDVLLKRRAITLPQRMWVAPSARLFIYLGDAHEHKGGFKLDLAYPNHTIAPNSLRFGTVTCKHSRAKLNHLGRSTWMNVCVGAGLNGGGDIRMVSKNLQAVCNATLM